LQDSDVVPEDVLEAVQANMMDSRISGHKVASILHLALLRGDSFFGAAMNVSSAQLAPQ
jgi:hypothetical protein